MPDFKLHFYDVDYTATGAADRKVTMQLRLCVRVFFLPVPLMGFGNVWLRYRQFALQFASHFHFGTFVAITRALTKLKVFIKIASCENGARRKSCRSGL